MEPYVIFKGKKDSAITKDLKKFVDLKKLKIIARTQSNAWINEELFIDYIDSILSKYKPQTKKLLIFNYCPAHSIPGVIEELKNKKY